MRCITGGAQRETQGQQAARRLSRSRRPPYKAPLRARERRLARGTAASMSAPAGTPTTASATRNISRSKYREPARPDHRRDRHRQDGFAADPCGGVFPGRRAGLRGRREGRPFRDRGGRRTRRISCRSAPPTSGFPAEYRLEATPTVFWDLFGEKGHPIRTTVSEMGPLLLARLMDLNATQEGVLNIAFKRADEEKLLLLDLKDLQALLADTSRRAPRRSPAGTATSPRRPSAPSSASSWCWSSRAGRASSASRRSRSPT